MNVAIVEAVNEAEIVVVEIATANEDRAMTWMESVLKGRLSMGSPSGQGKRNRMPRNMKRMIMSVQICRHSMKVKSKA
jgi:hypothetical protein